MIKLEKEVKNSFATIFYDEFYYLQASKIYMKEINLLRVLLVMRDACEIYLRHYTESISETIMFFIPIKYER